MAKKQDLKIRSHARHSAPKTSRRSAPERTEQRKNEPKLTYADPKEQAVSSEQPPVLQEVKKRRRRGRSILWVVASRLVLVGLVLAGGFAIWQNWERLAPDSLLLWIDETLGGRSGNGYPISITGSTVLHMADIEGSLALLNDTSFTMLNSRGEETVRRPHTYTSPMMKTAGKYALVAEVSGTRLSLETRSKTVWSKTLDNTIVSASVSKSGATAVVTAASQSYSCEILAFDSKGKQIYRLSRRRQAVDVAVSPDGKQAAVVSVAADNGDIRSYLEVFRLDSDSSEPVFSKEQTGILLCAAAYLTDGRLAAVGDTALWIADPGSGTTTSVGYDGRQLLGYAVSGDTAAVVTRPYGSTDGGQATVVTHTGETAYTAEFTGAFRHIAPSRGGYLLLTNTELRVLDKEKAGNAVSLPGDGRLVSGQGDHAVVLGLTALTQVELNGKG